MHRDELRHEVSSPVDNKTATSVLSPQPVDNFVDSSSPFIGRPYWDRKEVRVVDN